MSSMYQFINTLYTNKNIQREEYTNYRTNERIMDQLDRNTLSF